MNDLTDSTGRPQDGSVLAHDRLAIADLFTASAHDRVDNLRRDGLSTLAKESKP